MIIPIVIGLGLVAAGIGWIVSKGGGSNVLKSVRGDIADIHTFLPDEKVWPIVEFEGHRWRVAPKYIPHVGIQEAQDIAHRMGTELPSKGLVDTIWKAADLKIEPQQPPLKRFDFQEMNSPETVAAHAAKNEKQIANRPFKLLAGTHKDVVRDTHRGRLVNGIYGWHKLDGKPIQDFPSLHITGNAVTSDHKDYSQGLRLVRRVD